MPRKDESTNIDKPPLWIAIAALYEPPTGPTATGLLVEGLRYPAGLLNPTPTLSWEYVPGDRPGEQTAYRILCATSRVLLTPADADLWDSGIIESAARQATYAGEPLLNWEMVFWRVLVRDPAGVWSE